MSRVFWLLVAFLVACCTNGCADCSKQNGAPISMDPCADQGFRDELLASYEQDIAHTQVEWSLTQAWTDWAINPEHKGWYTNAYVHARCRNPDAEVLVLVTYFGGKSKRELFFRDGWNQEKEDHFRNLVERHMEEIFPGYNFYLSFNSPGQRRITEEDAKLVLVVGYTGPASFATDKYAYLIYPTIVGHEVGHLCPQPTDQNGWCMGFPHHHCEYDRNDQSCGPPGEYEQGCIMSRTAVSFGPLEQAVCGFQYLPGAEDRIELLGQEIRAMLPPEMNTRGESETWSIPTKHRWWLSFRQRLDHFAQKLLLQSGR